MGTKQRRPLTIEVGKPAPAFALKDASGTTHTLADYAGQDVVVYFYPRDETPGCTKEACRFRDIWNEFRTRGVVVLGVSPDSAASHAKFAANHRLPFPLLSDPERRVMERYGAWGEKVLYGRITEGVIRSTVWIGPDGRVRKHWKRVGKAAEHPDHVLAAVTAAS
jgi:peroxiredoxin Q/BCP